MYDCDYSSMRIRSIQRMGDSVTINTLFLKKLLIAFIVGALPTLIAFLSSVEVRGGAGFTRAALVTLASGAIAAGIRAVLVLLPVNLVPSDAEPILTKTPQGSK